MTIIYSLISRGTVILVEKSNGPDNYQDAAKGVLSEISTTSNRKTSYQQDNYTFHTVTDNGMVYLCAAHKEDGRRIAYLYLEDIKKRFNESSLVQRAASAETFEFNREFRKVLSDQMDTFNSGKGDSLSTLQSQVSDVTLIMRDNVEKVLERGDKLDDLVDKTDELQASATTFKTTSTKISRKYFWQNRKMTIIIVVVVLVLILIIVLAILGATGVI